MKSVKLAIVSLLSVGTLYPWPPSHAEMREFMKKSAPVIKKARKAAASSAQAIISRLVKKRA